MTVDDLGFHGCPAEEAWTGDTQAPSSVPAASVQGGEPGSLSQLRRVWRLLSLNHNGHTLYGQDTFPSSGSAYGQPVCVLVSKWNGELGNERGKCIAPVQIRQHGL